jgi:alpha-1,2-mannosyltransferase
MASSPRAAPSRDPARVTFAVLGFGLLPCLLLIGFIAGSVGHDFGFDFRTFWRAAQSVTDGGSPYPTVAAVGSHPLVAGDYEYFVYPPPFAYALVPLGLLPFGLAAGLWLAALVACVGVALWALDVRDWRCYGLAFAAIPTLSALRLGAVTPVLVLLAALAWRYRDDPLRCGAAVGSAVMLKLFLWPLFIWLAVTRRFRAAGVAIGGATLVAAAAWAGLAGDGLRHYLRLLNALTRAEAVQSYSLVALADRLHLPDPRVSWLLLAAPVVLWTLSWCRGRSGRELEASLYTATIAVALVLTPILWLHYFALLLVPVALARPRLSAAWILIALFWLSPFVDPTREPLWRLLLVLGLALLTARWSTSPLSAKGSRRLLRGWSFLRRQQRAIPGTATPSASESA